MASATNLVGTVVETGELVVFDAAVQFVSIFIVSSLLVSYWNDMERRAPGE